ncbi:MAG: hypothetical protein HY423_13560 [Candidatus Lambdaproteobacteria bacterium]|nr:hypothetical protein [Candidatus Lambdaproteobacteria bacterium]
MAPTPKLNALAAGLYELSGDFPPVPLPRRMVVVALDGGQLAIHSGIALPERAMAELDALGTVAYVLVPNNFHTADAPWYADRYPKARVLVPRASRAKLEQRLTVSGALEDDWPAALAAHLERLPIAGVRFHESVLLHRASRTLIVTDLVFNFGDEFSGINRLLMRLNGSVNRFGPSRLMRYVLLKDKAALAGSLRSIVAWDFDRIVMAHGQIVAAGGKARLLEAFRPITGPLG